MSLIKQNPKHSMFHMHTASRSGRERERQGLTLDDAQSEQVAVLQPEQVTHLDQQLLGQGLHLGQGNEWVTIMGSTGECRGREDMQQRTACRNQTLVGAVRNGPQRALVSQPCDRGCSETDTSIVNSFDTA